MDDNNYAVFEIMGDEVNQITHWLSLEKAKESLDVWRKMQPYCRYVIFQRHGL